MRFSFLILFYFTTAIVLIISLLGVPLKFKLFRFFVILFTKNMVMVLKIFGIKIKVINGHLANQKGYLFASKHQSMFETIYYNHLFNNPSYILKKELGLNNRIVYPKGIVGLVTKILFIIRFRQL